MAQHGPVAVLALQCILKTLKIPAEQPMAAPTRPLNHFMPPTTETG